MSYVWKEFFKIRTYEVDLNNNLLLTSFFNYMQEAAANHADHLNFGYKDLATRGEGWILSRAYLEIYSYPHFSDQIIVETWAKSVDKLFALRDFNFFDNNNRLLAKATTAWLLVDIKNKRPLRIKNIEHFTPASIKDPAFDFVPEKILDADNKELVLERITSYSDIDLNMHVNNVKYIEYVVDSLGDSFFSQHNPKSVHINFLSELKCNENISIFKAKIDENAFYFEGTSKINKNFQLILKY